MEIITATFHEPVCTYDNISLNFF